MCVGPRFVRFRAVFQSTAYSLIDIRSPHSQSTSALAWRMHSQGERSEPHAHSSTSGRDRHAPRASMRPHECDWRLLPAHDSARALEQFYRCPLIDAKYVEKMRRARLNATGGLLPRYACRSAPVLELRTRRLLALLKGRTLVMVGDSVMEQHFHSLACTLLNESPLAAWWGRHRSGVSIDVRGELWKTRSCLPFAHDAVLCYLTAAKHNELKAPPDWITAAKLREALHPSDVVLLNVGVHFADVRAAVTHYHQLVGPLTSTTKPSACGGRWRECAKPSWRRRSRPGWSMSRLPRASRRKSCTRWT